MNQIVIGACVPFLVATLVLLARGRRASLVWLVATPLFMGLGSLWAVLPDLPRLFGRTDIYMRLLNDPRTDIFFFHYTIDRIETDSIWWFPAFLAILALLFAIAWRELYLTEKRFFRQNREHRQR